MKALVKSQEDTNKKIVEMTDKVLEKMNKKPESKWPTSRIVKYGAGTAALVYLAHPQLLQMVQKVPVFGAILLNSKDAVPTGVSAVNDLADAGAALLTAAGAVVGGIRQAASYFIKTKPIPTTPVEVAALGTSYVTNVAVNGIVIKAATAMLNLAVPGRNEFVPIKFSHILAASAIQAAVPGQLGELGSAVLEKVASEDGVNWAITGAVAGAAVKAFNLLAGCMRFNPPLGKKTFVLLTGLVMVPPEQLSAFSGAVIDKAGEFVSASAPIVKKGFTKFANSAFANATSSAASAFSEKLSDFGSAVSHAAQETAITAGVMGAAVKVFNVFARNRGFNSPLGTGTVAGLAIGAEILAENQFGAKTAETVSEGASFVKDTGYNLWSAAGEKWSDLKSAVPTTEDISSAADEKWSDLKSAVGNMASSAYDTTGNVASSAYDTVTSIPTNIYNWPTTTKVATVVTTGALLAYGALLRRFL